MIKVVWFVNVALPEASRAFGIPCFYKAGWLEAYIAALKACGGVKLTVVCRTPLARTKLETELDGVHYVMFPSLRNENMRPPVDRAIADYRSVVRAHVPDLVHYHGSEFHYGLLTARAHIPTPAILSIQGLMSECAKVYFGGLEFQEIVRSHSFKEFVSGRGIWWGRQNFKKRAALEREIIQSMTHIIGRTLWDRAHVSAISPRCNYHHCEELLRPEFYESPRVVKKVRRFSIFASTASYPIKGFHILLRAVALLKAEFPKITIRIADTEIISTNSSNGYLRFLYSEIVDNKLESHIEWLGRLDAIGVANALAESHVFVSSSVIENSSNAIGEAMMVGVPPVASFVGGNSTTLTDGYTGLLFPVGDHTFLAACLKRLFLDDELAIEISNNARRVAFARHDYRRVGIRLRDIYYNVVSEGEANCNPNQ